MSTIAVAGKTGKILKSDRWRRRHHFSAIIIAHRAFTSAQPTPLTFQISALSACVVVAISKSCRARPMSPRYSSMRAHATITGRDNGSRASANLRSNAHDRGFELPFTD